MMFHKPQAQDCKTLAASLTDNRNDNSQRHIQIHLR